VQNKSPADVVNSYSVSSYIELLQFSVQGTTHFVENMQHWKEKLPCTKQGCISRLLLLWQPSLCFLLSLRVSHYGRITARVLGIAVAILSTCRRLCSLRILDSYMLFLLGCGVGVGRAVYLSNLGQ